MQNFCVVVALRRVVRSFTRVGTGMVKKVQNVMRPEGEKAKRDNNDRESIGSR